MVLRARGRSSWRGSAGVALAVALAPAVGRAQEDPEPHIRRGVELRQQGRDEDALREFQQAYGAVRTSRALGQVALAEQALGHWLDADAHMRAVLGDTVDPWVTQNRPVLQRALDTVNTHIGRLDVRANVDNAELLVNNLPAGTLPLPSPIRVVTGETLIEVRARGYRALPPRSTTITAGAMTRETFELVRAPSGESVAPAPGASTAMRVERAPRAVVSRVRLSPLLWIGAGVAAASFGVAIALGVHGNSVQADYDVACQGAAIAPDCGNRVAYSQGQLDALSVGVNVLWALGMVGVATAGVGLLVSDFGGGALAGPRAQRTVRLSVAPGGAALRW